ncbi:MAG TPA: AAA family ATPase [Bryobacteraceae bacterium]
MKLISLEVENFRCIRKAKVEFTTGLNVLYGPNDLGKSSLVQAIRAALLLQTTAKEHEEFVSWDGEGEPYVGFVFESEEQCIWRVRKTFGAAKAFLDESRNGIDFTTDARGRDVDGRLRDILNWGLVPPGGKDRKKGMQATFLVTALLGEQDHEEAIFDQALGSGPEDSGRKQVAAALQAMAEDPLFKKVLTRVQERVDEAFTANQKRRQGKSSPWSRLREEIEQKTRRNEDRRRELNETQALESQIQDLHDRELEAKHDAEESEREFRRAEVLRQLQECAAADSDYQESERQAAMAIEKERTASAAVKEADEKAQAAREELAKMQNEDRARQRQLESSRLEARRSELIADQTRIQSVIDKLRRIEEADVKVRAADSDLSTRVKELEKLDQERERATLALIDAQRQDRELRAIRFWLLCQEAQTGLSQENAWREEAAQKRAAAAALEAAQPKFALPSSAELENLRRLETDLQVAAAGLNVGFSVRLQPSQELRVRIQRDGGEPTEHILSGNALETSARGQLRIDIDNVAEIAVSGGASDARAAKERLEARWRAEAQPALGAAHVDSLAQLAELAGKADRRAREIQAARVRAEQLDQLIAGQPGWAALLKDRQRQLAAAQKDLEDPDLAKLEQKARKLRIADASAAEKQLERLRPKLETLTAEEKRSGGDWAAARATVEEKKNSLEQASADLDHMQAGLEGDWRQILAQSLDRQAELEPELAEIVEKIQRLSSKEDRTLTSAQQAVHDLDKAVSDAEDEQKKAAEASNEAQLRTATKKADLQRLQQAASKLDPNLVREVSADVEGPPVTEENIEKLHCAWGTQRDRVKEIEGKIQEGRGALQQVGGEVARQRAEDAARELESARERERRVEREYNAWQLLRDTLREAEREEGSNLGRLLAPPIAKRFTDLTLGRYGKLALGPDLRTQGISVGGDERSVSLLSVGTRDQLATIFRLTLGQQLKSSVVLDDQLTQSDPARMLWLRDLLREVAAEIQVVVFTCRPEDYIAEAHGVHSVDLAECLQRSSALERKAGDQD